MNESRHEYRSLALKHNDEQVHIISDVQYTKYGKCKGKEWHDINTETICEEAKRIKC